VTRFKELRRVEAALVHKSEVELRWAQKFCEFRLGLSKDKRGASQWRKRLKEVEAALRRDEGTSCLSSR
jgi:hypothetical protein